MLIKNKYKIREFVLSVPLFVFLAFPASTNYKLKSFEFGAGGDADLSSSNYKLEGIVGELNGEQSSSHYKANSGIFYVQMANTPDAPTLVNSGNWYNKLKLTLHKGDNPADTTYAITISDNNFKTSKFIKAGSNAIGKTLEYSDFQTYDDWGGDEGFTIVGLSPDTTYKVKVKARQGKYTEGPYGPEAVASTVSPSLSFDVDVAVTDIETPPPYSVPLALTPGTVTTASNKVWIDLDTNGNFGADVYIAGVNGGLMSPSLIKIIPSVSGNLSSVSEGIGIQGSTATQASGGPLKILSPYNRKGANVGIVDTMYRPIFRSMHQISDGRGSFYIKVKTSATTPAGNDYAETYMIIATASF